MSNKIFQKMAAATPGRAPLFEVVAEGRGERNMAAARRGELNRYSGAENGAEHNGVERRVEYRGTEENRGEQSTAVYTGVHQLLVFPTRPSHITVRPVSPHCRRAW